MKRNASQTSEVFERFKTMKYFLVFEGTLVGLLAGLVAIFYRYILGIADSALGSALSLCKGNLMYMIIWMILLIGFAFIVGRLNRWEPLISGSGIPQVEAEMIGKLDPVWWKVLAAKFAGGFLCLLGGLSLGREGPSIQLGAMMGKGLSKALKRLKVEERFLITCGASAGLSAAFNAPLAGVMFALEEMHKSFSAPILVSAMAASVTSDFISKYVFGMSPVFHFQVDSLIPLGGYGLVILLGIICGLTGTLYNKVLLLTQDLYKKIPFISAENRIYIPFIIAGILGFVMPEVLGGGHHMIGALTSGEMLLKTAVLLLVVKFIFSMISFGSGAPGGIFFPLLVLGAYIGGAFGMVVIQQFGFDTQMLSNFIILAMAGFFASIVRAPITGIILISEMTGTFSHLLSLSVVSIISYLIAEILKSEPIYESLLERLLSSKGKHLTADTKSKILIEISVDHGSDAENQRVCDLQLPNGCLLVAIRRQKDEIIPKGKTMIHPGDVLLALVDDCDLACVQASLNEMTTV